MHTTKYASGIVLKPLNICTLHLLVFVYCWSLLKYPDFGIYNIFSKTRLTETYPANPTLTLILTITLPLK